MTEAGNHGFAAYLRRSLVMRRATLLLAAMVSAILVAGGVALSQTTPNGTIDANTLPPNDYNVSAPVGGTSYGGTGARMAQTFTALNSGKVTSAQVHLHQEETPFTTDVTVQIASVDALGVPIENVLATTTIPFCAIPVGQPGELVTASFDSPAAVVAGQQYALVLSTPGGSDGLYGWRFKDGDPLPNGQPWADQQDGPFWVNSDDANAGGGGRDLVFAIYLDGSSSAPSDDCSAPSYDFAGFFSPVDNPPTTNVVKAGSAIPLKFSLGGDKGLDIFAAGYPQSGTIPADPNASMDDIEQTVTAGESSLSYDAASDQYTYVWKTEKAWSGQTRQLVLKLDDDSEHKANFQFK
jgi:hypothetical protein